MPFNLDLGVEGAVVIGGKVQRGVNAAAEFGHMVLNLKGLLCRYRSRGCLGTMVGGARALLAAARSPTSPDAP